MLTRVAVFEGAIMTGSLDAFFADVAARLEPVWQSFPHVQAVRVLRTTEADPGAIPVVMVLEMDFASMADIHDCLSSTSRRKHTLPRSRCSSRSPAASSISLPRAGRCPPAGHRRHGRPSALHRDPPSTLLKANGTCC